MPPAFERHTLRHRHAHARCAHQHQLRSEDSADVVATWVLTRARPSKWTGPTLAAKGASDVAMEELVLVCEDIAYE